MITINFERTENGIFIPHVDVLRNLNRTFRRAGVDVGYSNGFVKHMSLKMTQPLPLGVADEDGYVTADIKDYVDLNELIARFNRCAPPFLKAKKAYLTEKNPNLAGAVNACLYRIRGSISPLLAESLTSLPSDYEITVKNKDGFVKKCVGPLIYSLAVDREGIDAVLAFGNVNLRADLLCAQFNADFGADFNVADVVRKKQLIRSEKGTLTAEKLLEEMCLSKSI